MNNIIEIKDLNFNYKDKKMFEKFNLNIKNKKFVTILGKSCSGKSTLAKILVGLHKTDSEIKIDGVTMSSDNINYLRQKMGVILENSNNQFVTNTVYEELMVALENLNYFKIDIDAKVENVVKLLGIENLINREIVTLSEGEKQVVNLAAAIIYEPKILIIDNALSMLDTYYKEIIFKTLNILRKKGMTIINFTSDPEEAIYGTDIIILDNFKLVINKPTLKALKEEKAFVNSGLRLPFAVDLSLKLNYYGIVDKIYLDEKSLVDEIWK